MDAITELHTSAEWRDALVRNGWTDAFLAGADFGAYVRDENAKLLAILTDLGLAG